VNTNLDVEDLNNTETVVYPNPAYNKIYVEANSEIENVTVFDLLGRSVLETAPLALKTELNLGNLKSGTYIIVISSEGKKSVKRILKE
jgi:hypothetical protein